MFFLLLAGVLERLVDQAYLLPAPLFCDPKPSNGDVFDLRTQFCHSAPHGSVRFRLQTPGQFLGGPKAIFIQFTVNQKVIWRSEPTR